MFYDIVIYLIRRKYILNLEKGKDEDIEEEKSKDEIRGKRKREGWRGRGRKLEVVI